MIHQESAYRKCHVAILMSECYRAPGISRVFHVTKECHMIVCGISGVFHVTKECHIYDCVYQGYLGRPTAVSRQKSWLTSQDFYTQLLDNPNVLDEYNLMAFRSLTSNGPPHFPAYCHACKYW